MIKHKGILAALAAAFLFGASTPFVKLLLGGIDPWLLAGVLYLASGVGLALVRLIVPADGFDLSASEWLWLAGAIMAGGVVGPVLLMYGLSATQASTASLLLNAESVLTALLAWIVFKENADRRIVLGMASIVAGAVILSWPGASLEASWPSLAVLGACLAWGVDNNLTRKVSLADPIRLASLKGLAAGFTNIALAFIAGAALPSAGSIAAASLIGFLGYGLSLVAFVVGLRELGTARTGAYFSTAPFVGAALSILVLGEPVTASIIWAGCLMSIGVWLHATERHQHEHIHSATAHAHRHTHDDAHHRHDHPEDLSSGDPHSHWHAHEAFKHTHSHTPDSHHRHGH